MSKIITLGLVEDDNLIRSSLQAYLGAQAEFDVTHSVSSVEAFMDSLACTAIPDIILMDIGLPGMSGIEGIRLIKNQFAQTEIMMLTIYPDVDKIFDSLCAGASGYLLKNTELAGIKSSLIELHQGGAPMSPTVARKVIGHFEPLKPNSCDSGLELLTKREQQVVDGLVDGLAYKQVATRLEISLETVRHHIKNIYSKLQVNSKAQVIARVLRR